MNDLTVTVDGEEIGKFDFMDCSGLVKVIDPFDVETVLRGTQNILDVLQNSVDQRVIKTFVIKYQ
ncbi:hypothetical protein [Ligilactobacillus ruminis]|uniref:hypothetical protein n=1 Tax=Ligilactobacillus ruminis TaxID=1623 RepID=UPI0009BB1545|nr:hypothetical protein [Ligilactobacillus ruminis]